MELNKYQINRIKASVIEDVAENLLRRLESAQELLNDEQNELKEMLTPWQMLLDQLDKSLCK